MKIEFEATFIDVDLDEIRRLLKELGARLVRPETLMKRVVFFPPVKIEGGWLRVRDEGDKVTMSLKQVLGDKIHDQKELELEINSFEDGVKMLEMIGAKKKAYQESKRESWIYDVPDGGQVKVDIDTWPGLNPHVEVEGENAEDVRMVSDKLGFDYAKAIHGAVDVIYGIKLGIPAAVINDQISELTFDNPPGRYAGKGVVRKIKK